MGSLGFVFLLDICLQMSTAQELCPSKSFLPIASFEWSSSSH